MTGKFIVIYGTNGIGKSTQARLLVERLKRHKHDAEYRKYPRYELMPSGSVLNETLRAGNPYKLQERELQLLFLLNMYADADNLTRTLEGNITVVTEDYVGTTLGWGITNGTETTLIRTLIAGLRMPDLAVLLDGTPFPESIEASHRHERNPELMANARRVFRSLATEFSWPIINANCGIEAVHEEIWKHVDAVLE